MKKFKRADTYWESETERQGKPVWPQEVDNESITMYERLNILNEWKNVPCWWRWVSDIHLVFTCIWKYT